MNGRKISVVAAEGTWVVRAGGAVIGESENTMELTIGDEIPRVFFPREDIGMAFLDKSETTTTTNELGPVEYFGIVTRSTVIQDAAWSYVSDQSGRIATYIAFDTDRVTVEEI